MSNFLSDRVVLITGASSGIGAALAQLLAEQHSGIRLILAARDADKLESVATHCRKAGADVLVVPTDITKVEQIDALVAAGLNRFGWVDILVNNAGYGQMGPAELIPVEAIRRQFEVNLIGPITLTRALIPVMRDRGGGRIINVSSLGGRLAFPFGGLYSASKFALEGISDAWRMELEPFNIRVSVVEPGAVQNDFVDVAQQQVKLAIHNPMETPYRAAFEKLEGLDQQVSRSAWTSEQVAKVVLKAISDRHPKPRYMAATGGRFLVFVMTKLMPTRLVDRFWQRFYGIDQVAKDWRLKQQPKGNGLAAPRK
ncbi:SDR family oxidoreductase [Oculatella sp. LEGE 06141]|uniref:SDR family oxidoreductase n=1 Tax=Oculatella sp. LEGE 06141 TaxID=1828648 RepID=UPI00187ECD7A|nr:SDR family oxidoreductase [Oculatella sp. LEGE 06141]MBE9181774.1 SDR family oxidoreductase [Oculatella sp. LEGE 06141]